MCYFVLWTPIRVLLLTSLWNRTQVFEKRLNPGSLAWDVDISLVRRVFLVKSVPTSAHTQLNCVFLYFCISVIASKKVAFSFTVFEFMAGSVVASA